MSDHTIIVKVTDMPKVMAIIEEVAAENNELRTENDRLRAERDHWYLEAEYARDLLSRER